MTKTITKADALKAAVHKAARERWGNDGSFRIEFKPDKSRVWLWHRKPHRIGWEVAEHGHTLAELLAKIEAR